MIDYEKLKGVEGCKILLLKGILQTYVELESLEMRFADILARFPYLKEKDWITEIAPAIKILFDDEIIIGLTYPESIRNLVLLDEKGICDLMIEVNMDMVGVALSYYISAIAHMNRH